MIALANTSAFATEAVLSVDYTVGQRANHVQVATPFLPAGAVVEIDLTQKLHNLGVDEFEDAGVDISYTGAPGTIIAKLTSADQSRDLAFDTPVKDPSAGMYRSSGSYPWRVDGDFSTILALKNVLAKTVNAMVILRFDGGQFALPRVTLEPFQTVSINLQEVIAAGKSDLDGNPVPKAKQGKVVWFQEEPDSLIGRAEVYNLKEGLSASFSCFYPCSCSRPYFTPNNSDTYLSPGNISLTYLLNTPISDYQKRYDCNNSFVGTFDNTSDTTFSSGNTGIFTFSGSTIQAVGVGTTTFSGSAPRNTVSPPSCPAQTQVSPGGNGTALCALSIVPGQFNVACNSGSNNKMFNGNVSPSNCILTGTPTCTSSIDGAVEMDAGHSPNPSCSIIAGVFSGHIFIFAGDAGDTSGTTTGDVTLNLGVTANSQSITASRLIAVVCN